MRILQVASFYAPTIGGMETVLRDLAEGLVAGGDEVTVLCSAEAGWGTDEVVDGVRVVRALSLGKVLSQPLSPLFAVALRRLARGVDVVHLHMPNPLAEAAVLALPPGVPVVVTYHADVIRQRRLKAFYGPIRDAVLRRCRRIVVPTENHVRFSEVLPDHAGKSVVVPFGLSEGRYRLDAAGRTLAEQLRARHGRFVLFVGRLVYYKGVDVLVESMSRVDAPLLVVGDGPLRPQIAARIASLGLATRVHMVGAMPQAQLNAHLDACAILALPSVSRSEGFGMTLLEGMLFAKPLVTTRLPSGVQMVNDDGRTGLQVPPSDPLALAAALNTLMADETRAQTMGAAGRERLETHFSLAQMLRGYRDVYRQALGG